MKFDSELLKTLSQVGYMACMKGMATKGEIIMEGIKGVRPKQVPVLIGFAVARISTQKYAEAENIIINDILSCDPDNITAITFLGIAQFEMGKKDDARICFKEVMKHGDENHKQIASVYSAEL